MRSLLAKITPLRKIYFASKIYRETRQREKLFARFRKTGATHFKSRLHEGEFTEMAKGTRDASDISDHLSSIFFHACSAQPRLIVELGTRGGESTRVLLGVARMHRSTMLSVDLDEACGKLDLPNKELWNFVKADDVRFGELEFASWCRARNLAPAIDVLFLDTSHAYEHTIAELKIWTRYLAEGGICMLHDTNMGHGLYARTDGSIEIGWDNQRGVIRALEEFLGRSYSEAVQFSDFAQGYAVIHYPYCNGLTVLKKCRIQ